MITKWAETCSVSYNEEEKEGEHQLEMHIDRKSETKLGT
jgi:hypothetical protein